MSARGPKRNNVLAGLFLIMILVLGVVLSFWVSDIGDRFGSFTTYGVDFSLNDGANGLEPGSPVMLGGKSVGRVVAVGWDRGEALSDGRAVPTSIRVKIKIREDIPLYSNALTQIERPILGGLAAINITSPGGPTVMATDGPEPTLLVEGDAMRGILAPGLLTQAGLGPEQVDLIKQIIVQINTASADIATITSALAPAAEPAATDVAALLASARRIIEEAEADYRDDWSPRISTAMSNFEAVSGKGVEIADAVQAGVADAQMGIADARSGIDEARGVIASSQEIVDKARPSIESILANVDDATRHFNEQTTADIDQLMARGTSAVDQFGELGAKANLFFDEQSPQIDATLANVRLASMDGRLFINELRAQPQRLLRPPNKKELERELLYSSARAYAAAASDLRASSAALDNVLSRLGSGESVNITPADIAALQTKLHKAFEQYQGAESDLLDAIIKEAP